MAKLLNKLPAPVEFLHAGTLLKLPPGEVVDCPDEFLGQLAGYETVNAYFDQGLVEMVEAPAAMPAAKAETKKSKKESA